MIEYNLDVQKTIRKLDPQTRQRIRTFLSEQLLSLANPRQTGKALQGARFDNLWRYRVGDYRIICELQDHRLVVLVVSIGHRCEIYR